MHAGTCIGGWERSQNCPEIAPVVLARLKLSRAPQRSRHSLTSPATTSFKSGTGNPQQMWSPMWGRHMQRGHLRKHASQKAAVARMTRWTHTQPVTRLPVSTLLRFASDQHNLEQTTAKDRHRIATHPFDGAVLCFSDMMLLEERTSLTHTDCRLKFRRSHAQCRMQQARGNHQRHQRCAKRRRPARGALWPAAEPGSRFCPAAADARTLPASLQPPPSPAGPTGCLPTGSKFLTIPCKYSGQQARYVAPSPLIAVLASKEMGAPSEHLESHTRAGQRMLEYRLPDRMHLGLQELDADNTDVHGHAMTQRLMPVLAGTCAARLPTPLCPCLPTYEPIWSHGGTMCGCHAHLSMRVLKLLLASQTAVQVQLQLRLARSAWPQLKSCLSF